jgi:hypothetical protein
MGPTIFLRTHKGDHDHAAADTPLFVRSLAGLDREAAKEERAGSHVFAHGDALMAVLDEVRATAIAASESARHQSSPAPLNWSSSSAKSTLKLVRVP